MGLLRESGYTSMVDNEILPLLRDIRRSVYGREGDSLRATLGDQQITARKISS